MPFPISVRGQFKAVRLVENVDVRSVVISEAGDLIATRSDDVEVVGQMVISRPSFLASFAAPGTNWHPMAPFDNVKIIVTGSESEAIVSYELSTRRMLWMASLMALAFMIFIEGTSIGYEGPVAAFGTALKFACGAFFWLFGMNFVFGWMRGPHWLRSHLAR